jgi:hypothetical protein
MTTLTLKKAKELKGLSIRIKAEGYAEQDTDTIIVVGEVMSEYDIAKLSPCDGYNNRAEYWESYMNERQLEEKKTTLQLLDFEGKQTYIRSYFYPNRTQNQRDYFTLGDSDRYVSFNKIY